MSREAKMRLAAAAMGIFVVLVGAADVSTRVAHALFGARAAEVAFAPAIAALEPLRGTAAATTGAFTPARLSIPAIGLNAPVELVGKRDDGTMGAPAKFGEVGWYEPGAKPGAAAGSAVFAGHVDNALTEAGVFEHLSQLKAGDYITVSDASGRSLIYRVSSSTSYPADQAPLAQIFATGGDPQIALITCTGNWVTSEHQFDQRLVVIAKPVR